jgi:hypothetical protein
VVAIRLDGGEPDDSAVLDGDAGSLGSSIAPRELKGVGVLEEMWPITRVGQRGPTIDLGESGTVVRLAPRGRNRTSRSMAACVGQAS